MTKNNQRLPSFSVFFEQASSTQFAEMLKVMDKIEMKKREKQRKRREQSKPQKVMKMTKRNLTKFGLNFVLDTKDTNLIAREWIDSLDSFQSSLPSLHSFGSKESLHSIDSIDEMKQVEE